MTMHRNRAILGFCFLAFVMHCLAQPSQRTTFDIRMIYQSPTAPARAFQSETLTLTASADSMVRVDLTLNCSPRRTNLEAVTITPSGVRALGALIRMTVRDATSRDILFAKAYRMPVLGSQKVSEVIPLGRSSRQFRLVFEERWSENVNGRQVSRGGALVDWEGSVAIVQYQGTPVQTRPAVDTNRRRFKVD